MGLYYLSIYTDGGARGNPGPAAIGFFIKDNHKLILKKSGQFIGRATNNTAEYLAVIAAMNWIIKNKKKLNPKPNYLQFFSDSLLMVNQLKGIYKIKNDNLRNLAIKIKSLERLLKLEIKYSYIPREKNTEADNLLNQALNKALKAN